MPTFITFLFPSISVHAIRSDSLSICIHLNPDNSGPPNHVEYLINNFYWCTMLVFYITILPCRAKMCYKRRKK